MKYVMRIEFEEVDDDTAKEVMDQALNEVDSLAVGNASKGVLLYEDGETRVP